MELKMNCDLMPLVIEVHRKKEGKEADTYKYELRTADSFSTKQIKMSGLLLSDIFAMLGFKHLSVQDVVAISKYAVTVDEGYHGEQGNIKVLADVKTHEPELRVEHGVWTKDLAELVETANKFCNQNETSL